MGYNSRKNNEKVFIIRVSYHFSDMRDNIL